MKQKLITNKFKLLLVMAFAMLMGQNVKGVTIVNFPMNADYTNEPSSSSTGNENCVVTETASGTVGYDNTTGATVSGWQTTIGKGWETSAFNTTNFVTLSVTAQVKSSVSGPRNFKLQYSLNGIDWLDVANLPAMTTDLLTMGNISLPAACANQPSVYLKIATIDLQKQDQSGNISSGGTSSIMGLVISGEAPSRPTTQASAITLIKITSTSIKVGCTGGTGNRRIIVMNTSNSFTSPADNFDAGVVSSSYTSGEQIIYNGTGTTQTVTVSNSSNEYWFRVYDYNYNDGMTRYITTTESSNPKKCLLEICILPTHTNIGLITATLGGTVTDPPTGPTGSITSRGIYWSESTGVSVNDNKVFEPSNSTGIFTINVLNSSNPQLPRGTRIYYKAFVENASGKSLSEESFFDNIPIFTGPGNWETPGNWNVNEIPGSTTNKDGSVDDSPIIDGNCILNTSNSVTDLTINAGKKLTISTGAIDTGNKLTVTGTLTNDAGTSGILIKSAENRANGSLVYADGTNINAQVEMYSKAFQEIVTPTYHKNKWQYFGIPVTTLTMSNTFGVYPVRVRKYDETNITSLTSHPEIANYGLWKPADQYESTNLESSTMGQSEVLSPIDGYEVVQPSAYTYIFSGVLNHGNKTKVLPKTTGADWSGSHILANPFPAALDITKLTFGTNLGAAVYQYNAGSLSEWTTNGGSSTDGTSPGQYTASTKLLAGQLGTPRQIPSMQGFLVISNGNTLNTFGMPYTAVMENSKAQRAPEAASTIVGTRIDVIGTILSDRMWIFTDPSCKRTYDNGYDGYKMFGSSLAPQLYSIEEDGNYQINAVNDINNSNIGFKAGQDKNLKLVFTHQNMESYGKVYLVDLVANKTIDVTATGTEYAFTTEATPTAVNRFKIVTQTTAVKNATASQLKLVSSQNSITISNPTNEAGSLVIYNLSGSAIQTIKFDANGLVTIPTSLGKGIYVAKATTATEEVKEKLIIR